MSSGILTIASRIYDEKGPEALAEWEASLTPQQKQWLEDDWQEFTLGMKQVARQAKRAAKSLERVAAAVRL